MQVTHRFSFQSKSGGADCRHGRWCCDTYITIRANCGNKDIRLTTAPLINYTHYHKVGTAYEAKSWLADCDVVADDWSPCYLRNGLDDCFLLFPSVRERQGWGTNPLSWFDNEHDDSERRNGSGFHADGR